MTPIEKKRDDFLVLAAPLFAQLEQVKKEVSNSGRGGFSFNIYPVSLTNAAEIITNWCGTEGGHLIVTLTVGGHFKADLANKGDGQKRHFIEGDVARPEDVQAVGEAIMKHWKNGQYRPC